MITIHIEPTETNPRNDDRIIEPAQNSQNGLTRTILGFLILLAILGFLILSLS